MNLETVRDALLTLELPVSHFKAAQQTDQYIVWAEEGPGDALHADNVLREQAIRGTVDYYTRVEYDATCVKVQRALTTAGIPFRLNSIQRETETGYTHYEWVWEIGADDF